MMQANGPIPSTSTASAVYDHACGSSASTPGEVALATAGLDELPSELVYKLSMSWSGQKFEVSVVQSDTIGDLKAIIWSLTTVPPDRQKIIGLVKGKLPDEEDEVWKLGLSPTTVKPFLVVGTPEGKELQETGSAMGESVPESKDMDYSNFVSSAAKAARNVRTRRKLKETADKLKIDIINPPRPGKRLLVLDLDFCVLDSELWKEPNFSATFFARPFLHEFLTAVSPYYDLVIWSQTSWRWLESKVIELGLVGEEKKGPYHLVFVLDRTVMFSIYSERKGEAFKHEVKALPLIWGKFSEYTAKNTIHVDDLSRNFALQPRNGLKVKAYRDAMHNQDTDRELCYVARYLLQLTSHDDFTQLDHKSFRTFDGPLPPDTPDPVLTWGRDSDTTSSTTSHQDSSLPH